MNIRKNATQSVILATIALGLTTTAIGQFNSLSKVPNPQSGRWVGDAYYYWDGFEGVTFARLSEGTNVNLEYWNKGQRRSDGEWVTYDYGVSAPTYKLRTYTWSAYDWTYGQSRVQGVGGDPGYASGDIWEN